jgi:hypothetical protein
MRTSFGPPLVGRTASKKPLVAPAEKDTSGYVSTHVINMVDTSVSEEETSCLRHYQKRTNKSPLCDASPKSMRVADIPMIECLILLLSA